MTIDVANDLNAISCCGEINPRVLAYCNYCCANIGRMCCTNCNYRASIMQYVPLTYCGVYCASNTCAEVLVSMTVNAHVDNMKCTRLTNCSRELCASIYVNYCSGSTSSTMSASFTPQWTDVVSRCTTQGAYAPAHRLVRFILPQSATRINCIYYNEMF